MLFEVATKASFACCLVQVLLRGLMMIPLLYLLRPGWIARGKFDGL